MRKTLLISVGVLLLLSSCGTYTETGATTGGWFGSIIGSAIGGIAGGPRGSDVGTLVGMAGGAMVGAAIGQAADNAERQKYEDYKMQREQRRMQQTQRERSYDNRSYNDDSGYDAQGNGDDRLYGFGEDFNSTVESAPSAAPSTGLEIRNPRLVDAGRDGVLSRGEEARMLFEVFNTSSRPIYRVQPTVVEVTGNRHIRISENVLIECIMPGKGIRYTAVIKADDRLRDGDAVFRIGVKQANKEIPSQNMEFPIQTSRR